MDNVTDLEEYRAMRLDIIADECATGVCLIADWQTALMRHADPTAAHLVCLADALDEVADAESWDQAIEMLTRTANAARSEALRMAHVD